MNIECIDEAEALIRKYRKVMAAKRQIDEILGEDGGNADEFVLIDKGSRLEICLHGIKAESLDAIADVLNEQYDKITARLREI